MRLEHRKLIYLACPYTHTDHEIMVKRFVAASKAAGHLISRGYFIFSPITHTHPIHDVCELPRPFHYWQECDELMISRSDYLVVLTLEGWEESVGVTAERKFAERIGKPIFYADPDKLEFFALGGATHGH